MGDPIVVERNGITTKYYVTADERVLEFVAGGRTAAITVNRNGYGMLKVRVNPEDRELERYYGFDMALDHAADELQVRPSDIPIPDEGNDLGM